MPIPKPTEGETEKDFMSRCAGDDIMMTEYPDSKQRIAVCATQWKEKDKQEFKLETVDLPFIEIF